MSIHYTNKYKIPFEVDDADDEIIQHYTWCINGHGDPCTNIRIYKDTCSIKRLIELHKFLFGKAPLGKEWDHKDKNKKNNCRCNIRPVTASVNAFNKDFYGNNSGVRGICRRGLSRWEVFIGDIKNKRRLYLGSFSNFEDAIVVRKAAELEYYGELCK